MKQLFLPVLLIVGHILWTEAALKQCKPDGDECSEIKYSEFGGGDDGSKYTAVKCANADKSGKGKTYNACFVGAVDDSSLTPKAKAAAAPDLTKDPDTKDKCKKQDSGPCSTACKTNDKKTYSFFGREYKLSQPQAYTCKVDKDEYCTCALLAKK